jgi:hypothetical protein
MSKVHAETSATIQMMRLFQDNVKKDINYTNNTIKMAQDKLRDCDLNLSSLKKFTTELNVGFANIETQVSKLDMSFKDINLMSSHQNSRNSSVGSGGASFSDSCELSSDESFLLGNKSELLDQYSMEAIEKTYVFVTRTGEKNDNAWKMEDKSETRLMSKHGSLSSLESGCSDLIFEN